MSWANRLRLFFGLIFVGLVLFGLLLALNFSLSNIGSRTAQLQADTFTVGTDYSGIITKQYVTQGQHVSAGQSLFLIKSSLLSSEIASGTLDKSDLAYSIDDQNQITLKATNPGTISDISYLEGAFVPANKEVATVTRDNSFYVEAKFELSPPDYARIHNGDLLTVTLPNNQKVDATVFDVSVESADNDVQTVIKARVKDLRSSTFTIGTPVSSELHLSGKTLYDSTKESLQKLFKPRG